jgi:hypothetical protein
VQVVADRDRDPLDSPAADLTSAPAPVAQLRREDRRLRAALEAELGQQVAGVVLHRLLRQAHPRADLAVGEAFPDQPENRALLVGEQADPVASGRARCTAAGHRRADLVEQRSTGGDRPDRRHQGRPADLLEQETGGTGADGGLQRLPLGVAGQDQAAHPVHPLVQFPAEVGPASVRQPHVDEHDVGPDGGNPRQRLRDRAGLTGDGDAGVVLEDLGHATADHLVVVDEEDTHSRGRVHGIGLPRASSNQAEGSLGRPAVQRNAIVQAGISSAA